MRITRSSDYACEFVCSFRFCILPFSVVNVSTIVLFHENSLIVPIFMVMAQAVSEFSDLSPILEKPLWDKKYMLMHIIRFFL